MNRIDKQCKKHDITPHYKTKDGHWRCCKCNTEGVTLHRQQRKLRLLQLFGGTCWLCGYNKSVRALHFHHLDPTQKDFAFSSGVPRNWDKMVKEAKKCILLCSNCHCEVHDGIAVVLPEMARSLLAQLEERLAVNQEVACSKRAERAPKPRPTKITWPPIDELVDRLQVSGYKQLGRELGVSDNAVRKRLHTRQGH